MGLLNLYLNQRTFQNYQTFRDLMISKNTYPLLIDGSKYGIDWTFNLAHKYLIRISGMKKVWKVLYNMDLLVSVILGIGPKVTAIFD